MTWQRSSVLGPEPCTASTARLGGMHFLAESVLSEMFSTFSPWQMDIVGSGEVKVGHWGQVRRLLLICFSIVRRLAD